MLGIVNRLTLLALLIQIFSSVFLKQSGVFSSETKFGGPSGLQSWIWSEAEAHLVYRYLLVHHPFLVCNRDYFGAGSRHNEDKQGAHRQTKHTVHNCGRFRKWNGTVCSGSWDVYTVDMAVDKGG
jgi:hypothetical protein